MIYDFLFLITARPTFPYMKRIMLGFVCGGSSGFMKVYVWVCLHVLKALRVMAHQTNTEIAPAKADW